MPSNASQPRISTPAADDAAPTIIVPVNQPAVDTGLRVPVEPVTTQERGTGTFILSSFEADRWAAE